MRARMLFPLLLLTAAPAAGQAMVCPIPDRPPGEQQSPINIVGASMARLDSVRLHYPPTSGTARNTGHDIQVDVDPGNFLMLDGVRFELNEFHFHWPAEHRIMGDTFSVEIHMVHRSAANRIVVLSTWVKIGAQNPAWNTLWANLPARGGPSFRMPVDIPRLFSLRSTSLSWEQVYRYCGSLTTGQQPPFQEGVTWLVRNHPIEMSRHQVEMLQAVMNRWSRGTQSLNNRPILYWIP